MTYSHTSPHLQFLRKLNKQNNQFTNCSVMNECTKGAFECLSGLEARMVDLDLHDSKWDVLKKEVDDAIHDIRKGMSVDFRHRLRARMR